MKVIFDIVILRLNGGIVPKRAISRNMTRVLAKEVERKAIFLVQMGLFYQIGFVYDLFREGKFPFGLRVPMILHNTYTNFAK